MNLVTVIIYNREVNLKHWLHCWQQCTPDAQLVIIHNSDGETYSVPDGVIYIKRNNVGFDIGAMQDVFSERLPGFPNDWDNLLWCTDDTFPMFKDFTKIYWEQLKTNGIAAMCISPFVRKHIRTTGFAIKKDVSKQITFPADPITTKHECYEFEHLSVQKNFLSQVIALGYTAVQVASNETSPMYDTEYTRRIKPRIKDHYTLFGDERLQAAESPSEPLVVFICPAYNAYPYIVHSLQQQTYQNWKLYLIHDGPNETGLADTVHAFDDHRIHYEETDTRSQNWGHSIRSEWLQKAEGDYVVITNQDNYHVPVFIEYMLRGFNSGGIATYCGDMVHSYKAWQIIPCMMKRGYVDCAGVMIRMEEAKRVGWNDTTSHSADWFFFDAIIKRYGINSFIKVKGCLLIHN